MTLGARVLVLKCMIFSIGNHVLTNAYFSTDRLEMLQKVVNRLEMLQKVVNDFLWRGQNRLTPAKYWNTPKWGGLNHLHIKHFVYNLRTQ